MDGNLFSLAGKTAFVTGGTRGIGLAIATALQQAGAKVWIHGSKKESTQKVALEHGFSFVYGDLLDEFARQDMVQQLKHEIEKLDILVNNAGFEYHSSIAQADEEYLDSIYQVNAKSPYLFVRDLLPLMQRGNGASIINVTSIHEVVPVRGNSSYCMAKAALAMFTKTAALEFGKWNIRVNNLAPGAISTDMNHELLLEYSFDEWIPLGRVGQVQDIAGPAVFLASDASSYMTGATLTIDGGYSQNLLRY